ncbi:MAG: DUF2059 domain-containing protein [Chitinivibrionales bacterium]|nr:DUF2059 domain-containing protein [Chitinivibrionales bacterium]
MHKVATVLCCILALGSGRLHAAQGALTPAKKRDIKVFMELTGALRMGERFGELISARMAELYRSTGTEVPDSVVRIVKEEVRTLVDEAAGEEGGLMDTLYAIYHEHFSHDDIKRLIAFYQTDVGRKAVRVMPVLTREAAKAGSEWGAHMAPVVADRLRERLDERGIELPTM